MVLVPEWENQVCIERKKRTTGFVDIFHISFPFIFHILCPYIMGCNLQSKESPSVQASRSRIDTMSLSALHNNVVWLSLHSTLLQAQIVAKSDHLIHILKSLSFLWPSWYVSMSVVPFFSIFAILEYRSNLVIGNQKII